MGGISSDGAGGAIVTWGDYRSGSYDIYAQRVNASGIVQWTANGFSLCTATGDQNHPRIISDGAGGAIVTWGDYRSGNYDIYAQKVNSLGAAQWTANGVVLCTATGEQNSPQITSDGAAGAIVTWYDYRSGNYDIYAQKVNSLGAVQWTANGVGLCTATGGQDYPQITSDGAGGAIVTWSDSRGASRDIYAQKVDHAGAVQWVANGVALCTASESQGNPAIISNGAGGAIVAWHDGRISGDMEPDIYAQSIDSHGSIVALAPHILSAQDVPNDQGGWVRVNIERSGLDESQQFAYPISTYNIWQRIDNATLLAFAAQGCSGAAAGARVNEAPLKTPTDPSTVSGLPVRELNGRYFVQSKDLLRAGAFPAGVWELLGSFAACQQDQYIYRASTLADSTASGIPYSVYMVSAHTTTPSVWFVSEPDSGCSVDNIPPGPPAALAAEQGYAPAGLALSWEMNPANDLSYYAVYRGSSEDFVPGSESRVGMPTAPEYFDGSWRWSSGYYYKISAIDIHGNESGFALLRPDDVTGDDTPKVPEESYLSQNYPNPFNPMTRIEFGLAAPGHITVRIYDAAGRLVRELVDEAGPAARHHAIWDGRDDAGRRVASGVYFYRLDAGSFTKTRKMILLQ